MKKFPILSGAAIAALCLSACASDAVEEEVSDDVESGAPSISVVATTTILGDIAGEILTCALGDDSSLSVLMPLGADPHDFQASSSQVAEMASADSLRSA